MAATKIVSFSELDTYRQCRLKHHLGYKERWVPKETAPALSRGSLWHKVLEVHYKAIMDGLTAAGAVQTVNACGLLQDEDGHQSEEQELIEWMYQGYVECYNNDQGMDALGKDWHWEIVEIEAPIMDWLPTEHGTRSTFKLKGKADLLVRDHSAGGGLWVPDHKTCRNLPKGKDPDFDDQLPVYMYLLKRRGLDIRGGIFNYARTQRNKGPMALSDRFKRVLTVRTDQELENIALEILDTFREAYKPRRKGQALPPRSPDQERCGWRCPFTEPCLGGRKGMDIHGLLEDHQFVQDFTRH